MVLTIDGIDVLPYVAHKGIKWQRSDLDDPKAGRTMDGVMHRGRVATKIRLDITCKPLRASEVKVLLNVILPEFVSVTYLDPQDGLVTRVMYSNNNPASHMMVQPDGTEWWDEITFPLIER